MNHAVNMQIQNECLSACSEVGASELVLRFIFFVFDANVLVHKMLLAVLIEDSRRTITNNCLLFASKWPEVAKEERNIFQYHNINIVHSYTECSNNETG